MEHIGVRIKERREQLKITQSDLACKLGYKDKSSIAKIESGAADIVQSKVVAFASALDTTVAYLMGWTVSDKNSELNELILKLDDADKDNLKLYINNMLLSQPKYQLKKDTTA